MRPTWVSPSADIAASKQAIANGLACDDLIKERADLALLQWQALADSRARIEVRLQTLEASHSRLEAQLAGLQKRRNPLSPRRVLDAAKRWLQQGFLAR